MNAGGATAVAYVLALPVFGVFVDIGAVNRKKCSGKVYLVAIAVKALDMATIASAMALCAVRRIGLEGIQN